VIKRSARCTGPACVKPVSVFGTGSTYSRKAASIRVWAGREGSASGCRNRSLLDLRRLLKLILGSLNTGL
jgi:hypothetical protein